MSFPVIDVTCKHCKWHQSFKSFAAAKAANEARAHVDDRRHDVVLSAYGKPLYRYFALAAETECARIA